MKTQMKFYRHNLLRVMVYFYNEYLIDRLSSSIINKKQYQDVKEAIAAFKVQKKDLVEAFMDDAAVYNFSASKKLWSLRSDNEDRFANIVLAEAIDSYYCSPDTSIKFRKYFKATHRVFSGENKKDSLAKALGNPIFSK